MFKCRYLKSEGSSPHLTIDAENEEQAYEKYLEQVGQEFFPVIVLKKGLRQAEYHFENHYQEKKAEIEKKKAEIEKKKAEIEKTLKQNEIIEKEIEEERIRNAIIENRRSLSLKGIEILEKKKNDGYFKLETNEKITFQEHFNNIISESEQGPLLSEEINFIERWLKFKHRELGQTLLTQAEAQKPLSQQGQSELANTIFSGIAMGNLVKANQLNEMREMNQTMDEIAEDVEDVNEGFGFE